MKRYKRYSLPALLTLSVLTTLFLLFSGVVGAKPSISQARSPIPGHLIPSLKGHTPVGAPDAQQKLQLTISLNLADPAGLQALIDAQNDPKSPLYHQYITPQQFTGRYAPSQASVDSVVSFLKSQGLTVQSVADNRMSIDAEGTVATIEQAFGVHIANYSLNGHTVFAPSNEPSVPSSLARLILNIGGLDNTSTPHRIGSLAPKVNPQMNATGPGGGYTPGELNTAYDMNSLINLQDGTGQQVALVELDGYKPGDIVTYRSFYGLPNSPISNVFLDGATITPTAQGGAGEVELDMEVMSAIAPGAAQKIYIAPNGLAGFKGFLDDFKRIVSDNTARVVSNSWGLCESLTGTSSMQAFHTVFAQGAAQGQAFFTASGDWGSADCFASNLATGLAVDYPASDPLVVSVGGTSLTTGSGGSYVGETVWNEQPGHGSGGGISTFFAQPSYQAGPGVLNSFSNGKREVPDVSADADVNTGYSIFCTDTTACAGLGWLIGGGTSAAAPLWAGIATDINAYLISEGKATIGSASATLYRIFNTPQALNAYHDITSGNNDSIGTNGGKFPATSGYDLASGIGTPDVWNLARDIAGDVPSVTPGLFYQVIALGESPSSPTFTIHNNSANTYNWSLSGLQSWVSATPSSGSILAHQSQTFTLNFSLDNTLQTATTNLAVNDGDGVFNPLALPVTVSIASTSNTWFFAEGFTGTGFTEYLTLANPNPNINTVTVQYLLQGQGVAPITKQFDLQPNSRRTINVNSTTEGVGPGQNVSVIVTGTLPLVAERPMYFHFGTIPGGSDVLGATGLSTNFNFGYLDTTANHSTYLTILNPDPNNDMDVTIDYFPAAGGAPIEITHQVPKNSRGTFKVNSEHPTPTTLLPAGTYSALVHLSQKGLVERPMYLKDGTTGFTGAADVVGVANPLTDWDFAEGFISSTFSERYILSNPSTTDTATGTITFILANGSTHSSNFTLAPGQQKIINASSVSGVTGNNSAHVHANHAILAERFMSFKFGTNIPGASDVLGAAQPSHLFEFAEGFTGTGFSEYLTIENPSTTDTATVQVTFLPADGSAPIVRVYTIAPSSRFTLNTGTVITSAFKNRSFSMVVQSNVSIVAERPMYFLFGGTISGGSDVVGYQPLGS